MPYISSVTKFITRGKTTRVRVRCLTTWRYPNIKFTKMLPDTDVVTPFGRTTSATWRYPNIKF